MSCSARLSILFTLVMTFGLVGGDALAQKGKYNPFTIMKSLKNEKKKSGARGAGGPKRIREGDFKKFKKTKIKRSNTSTINIKDVIKANFGAAQKKASARGKKSLKSRGLYIKPALEEHGIETKDAIILSKRSTYVVTNPKKHGARGHRAKKGSRGGRANKRVKKSEVKLNKIPKKHRKFYEEKMLPALKSGSFPKGHPFRDAYDKKGIAGFLNAFADGKGDYSESDEVIIPKERPTLKDGRVRFPGQFMSPGGAVPGARGKGARFQTTKKINWLTNINKSKKKDGKKSKPKKKYSYQEAGGDLEYEHKFLTGFTWSEHWGKKYEKDYWLLEYRFWAFAGYTIGFRVPVKFKGKMSPAYIKTYANHKGGDKQGDISVKFTAEVDDEDANYYKSVGWTDKEPKARGKEFPFHLYFDAGAFVEIFGIDILDICVKRDKHGKCIRWELDYSQDLKPVFGKNQDLMMKGPGENKFKKAAFYIPSDITRTAWRVPATGGSIWAKAEGLLGAEFGGDGKVSAKVQAVINNKKQGKAKTITLTGKGKSDKFTFTVPKNKEFGTTKYGYKIWDPKYEWKVKIRPAVKAVISGECDHWWCGYAGPSSYELGPWYPIGWITLGTVKLDHHKGTTKSYTVQDGKKDFIKEDIRGESSMYVCLKSSKGKYVQASRLGPNEAFAKYEGCSPEATFLMQSADDSGKATKAPIVNERKVTLQSFRKRYLSIDEEGKFTAGKMNIGPSARFILKIQGAKKKQPLQAKDKIQLISNHGKKKGLLIAKNGGGGPILGKKKNYKKAETVFTVVESKKPNFAFVCPEGKRTGDHYCSVKKINALSKIGDVCFRTATECPCYVEKAKNSTAKVWCVDKIEHKLGVQWTSQPHLLAHKTVCSKSSKRREGKYSFKVGSVLVKVRSTECQVGSFEVERSGAICSPVSADWVIKTKLKNRPINATHSFVRFKQNNADCPFWINSKHKKISAYSLPMRPRMRKGWSGADWVKDPVNKGVTSKKTFRLKHKKTGLYLKMEKNGSLSVVKTFEDGWKSLKWEPETAGKFTRIRSVWKPKHYLHIQNGDLSVGPIDKKWHSAQWTIGRKKTSVKNRWKNTYLSVE